MSWLLQQNVKRLHSYVLVCKGKIGVILLFYSAVFDGVSL